MVLVNLKKKYVSTVPGIQDFDAVFIDPKDEMYIVRGPAVYRLEPSPVKVLTSGVSGNVKLYKSGVSNHNSNVPD